MTLAATALLAVGLGGAAPVATASTAEPTSELHLDDPTGDAGTVPRADETTAVSVDLMAADIHRLERRLVVRFFYDELGYRGMREWGMSFEIPDRHGELAVEWAVGRDDRGRWRPGGGRITRAGEDEELPVRCRALRGVPDEEADTLTLRIPQACFPRPGIVLESLQTYGYRVGRGTQYFDSPFADVDDPYGTRTPRLMAPAS